MRARFSKLAALAAICVAGATAAGTGSAAPQPPIASPTADVPIAAGSGWVVWSVRAAGGWGLEAWHGGIAAPLAISARPQPFDVDVGTDAHGRAVATFSRCSRTPALQYFDGAMIEPWTGAGCRVRVVDLLTGHESAVAVPHPANASDTTPSMWNGRVAFARRDAQHGDVAQVMLWSPGTHKLTALPHGALPTRCSGKGGCAGQRRRGAVQGLDLSAQIVAFRWWVDAPGVVGHGGWEIRADRLSNRRSTLIGTGFIGEACTGGVDAAVPTSPTAAGNVVVYSVLASTCYVDRGTLVRYDAAKGKTATGPLDGEVLELAQDGGQLYALVAPKPQGQVLPSCSTASPCSLVALATPSLTPYTGGPGSIFF
jgi:hypothetical protein